MMHRFGSIVACTFFKILGGSKINNVIKTAIVRAVSIRLAPITFKLSVLAIFFILNLLNNKTDSVKFYCCCLGNPEIIGTGSDGGAAVQTATFNNVQQRLSTFNLSHILLLLVR